MTGPSVTIAIGRPLLPGSLAPLMVSGTDDDVELGVISFQPPALQARNIYAPSSGSVDGDELTETSWQQAILGFDWVPDHATTEAEVQAAYREMAAAVGQFSFPVTTTVSDADGEVWAADRGNITLGGSDGRTYVDLNTLRPIYSVSIPVHPIPGSA